MGDLTCYACEKEPVALIDKGWKERAVCDGHLEQLREIGLDV